jgi:hypothetical protein
MPPSTAASASASASGALEQPPGLHLIVVQHGLWGNPSHTAILCQHLERELGKTMPHQLVRVVNSAENVGLRSYDGIDVCGDRLAALVARELRRGCAGAGTPGGAEATATLGGGDFNTACSAAIGEGAPGLRAGGSERASAAVEAVGPAAAAAAEGGIKEGSSSGPDRSRTVTHLTLIGYSLGGLVARYAAGKLLASGYFVGDGGARRQQAAVAPGEEEEEEAEAHHHRNESTAPRRPPKVVPAAFITIATPHLGSWRWVPGAGGVPGCGPRPGW